ncbi:MAG: DUF3793 family protein [Oscillospiraceae bacterium]
MSLSESMQFEKKLAFFTAPSLLGIKCANLISLNKTDYDLPIHLERFNRKTASKGLQLKILCTYQNRTLVLLYNETLLERQLSGEEQKAILQKYGYPETPSLESKLNRLAERIRHESQFPHEIGIFLGYPTEDVIGFMENKGENYKLCGYWKVYGNAEKAKRTFENYDKCRMFLCNKLNQGYNLYQALKIS